MFTTDLTEKEYCRYLMQKLVLHLKQDIVDIVDESGKINFIALENELDLFVDEWVDL